MDTRVIRKSRIYGKKDEQRCSNFNLCMVLGKVLDFWIGDPLQLAGIIYRGITKEATPIGHKIIKECFGGYMPEEIKNWRYPPICSARKWNRCERARRQAIKHRNRVIMDEVIKFIFPGEGRR